MSNPSGQSGRPSERRREPSGSRPVDPGGSRGPPRASQGRIEPQFIRVSKVMDTLGCSDDYSCLRPLNLPI